MTTSPDRVAEHYAVDELGARILDALAAAGANPDDLTVDDLAPVDAFHIRGRPATEELAALVEPKTGQRVLDVGSGLGGTARYLADRFECDVTGVDLTEAYCHTAAMLSDRVGLGDRTRFVHGSALDLPFERDAFDIVWTEHVQMNIADKQRFYGEIARVLGPGGRFAFHDIVDGRLDGLHYPVPWAGDASISHLVDFHTLRSILANLDMTTEHWKDETEAAIEFFDTALERIDREGAAPVGLHLLMGDDAAVKFGNVRRNLEEGRIAVVQAVTRAPD